MPDEIEEHIHPLPVCEFGQHNPHAPECKGRGQLVACGAIVDPLHPHFGKALCWHRSVDADPEESDKPEAGPEPADPLPPEQPEVEEPSVKPEPPPDLPAPDDSKPEGGEADAPESSQPESESGGGVTPRPPKERDWLWWLKYAWLLPLILLLMGLIALLAKILGLLGGFGGLVALLEKLWQALRDFLGGSPDSPPEGDGPDDGTPEDPEHEDEDTKDACELVSQPSITLGKEGWVLINPENEEDRARLVHEFTMHAKFGQRCKCCEYQQEIMGFFRERKPGGKWKYRELLLTRGKTLSRTKFEIDGKRQENFEYGRRLGQENIHADKYRPERRDGCTYEGYDLPGMDFEVGVTIEIDLTFRGQVIDRCNDRTLWQHTWRLHTKGYIEREPPTTPGGRGLLVYHEGELPDNTSPGSPTGGGTTPPPTGGPPTGGPSGILTGIPENLPWRSAVSDDEPCRAVKEQKMGGLLISCRGSCATGGPCRLQKRPAGSQQNWRDVPNSMETATPGFEYRGRC